jgi:uncharacterized membrane protein
MEDMGSQSMMNYTSYDGFLTGLLVLLIKFLFLILIFSIIIWAVIWIKNNYFKNTNFKQLMNQNPIAKSFVGIIAAIIILCFLMFILSYLTGNNYSMRNMNGNYSFGSALSLTGIIIFLFKALTIFFVITFIVSLMAYMFKQFGINIFHLFQSMDNKSIDAPMQNQCSSYPNIQKPVDEQENQNI